MTMEIDDNISLLFEKAEEWEDHDICALVQAFETARLVAHASASSKVQRVLPDAIAQLAAITLREAYFRLKE